MDSHNNAPNTLSAPPTPDALTPLATATSRHGLGALAARLLELRSWLQDDLTAVEETISRIEKRAKERAVMPGERVGRAAAHILGVSGKRVRPICVILAAKAGGRAMDGVVRNIAVASELVHAATLLHDDVIDESQERRGVPAARVVYGNAASILGGDHLLVESLRLAHSAENMRILSELFEVISRMVGAEALQLERRGRFEADRRGYLDVIEGKTAALFEWGLRSGATLGGLDDDAVDTLGRVGQKLGMAFQLVDDVLDFEGDSTALGKDALVDLREGKTTWPLILAAERDEALAKQLATWAAGSITNVDAPRVAEVAERVRSTGALEATRAFALRSAEEAQQELAKLPESGARRALELVVETSVQRSR